MSGFRTILVANRGEIACRVMRTAKAMGYRTAAVYSEADAMRCTCARPMSPPASGPADAQSELPQHSPPSSLPPRRSAPMPCIRATASSPRTPTSPSACGEAGLTFIGPSPARHRRHGQQGGGQAAHARRPACRASPATRAADQSDATLAREAERIGFPVMVKAAAGGGGRGMRLVKAKKDLPAALAAARAEAESAFGSGELILEKAVVGARHVEIQVLADARGNVIHLGERDCSVQRRHQKVLEEAPSPAVDAELRARMGAAAVAAAKAIGYTNAGTVEFLLGGRRRLLLPGDEHAPAGRAPRHRARSPASIWSSCRSASPPASRCRSARTMCASPATPSRRGSTPRRRTGASCRSRATLAVWRPPTGPGIRVDHGLDASQAVSPFYDPLLAKVIAHGATREEARRRLIQALEDTTALGIATNRGFLDRLPAPSTSSLPARRRPSSSRSISPSRPRRRPTMLRLALAAVLWFEASARRHGHDPARTWSSSGALAWPLKLEIGGKTIAARVIVLGPRRYRIDGGDAPSEVSVDRCRRYGDEVPARRAGAERGIMPSPATACISSSGPSTSPCARRSTRRPLRQGRPADRTRSCARP